MIKNEMIWKGENLNTIGKVLSAMSKIETPEEAREFMEKGRQSGSAWDDNIGYLTGYLSDTEASRLRSLLRVQHPIFGGVTPTPEEALKKGMDMGRSQ